MFSTRDTRNRRFVELSSESPLAVPTLPWCTIHANPGEPKHAQRLDHADPQRLKALAKSITSDVTAGVPHLERPHGQLQGHVEEIQKLLLRRDFYQARKQEATRKARARLQKARMTATLLRKTLIFQYGKENEQLARFGIQPFRGRKRSKKEEETPAADAPKPARKRSR